jgi:Domain of unknown function (DUF4136)
MVRPFGLESLRRWFSCLAAQTTMLLFLGVLPGPAGFAQKITTEFDRAADFTAFKTFAVREVQLTDTNPVLNSDLVKKRIQSEIERSLTVKGLAMVTGPSDLDVLCQFGSTAKEDVDVVRGGGRGTGPQVVRVVHVQGTLVIDLRHATTRSLIWRGVAVEQQNDPVKLQGKVEDMVKKSIAKYPPKK